MNALQNPDSSQNESGLTFLRFFNQLAANMLRCQFKQQGFVSVFFNLWFDIFLVLRKFSAELCCYFNNFILLIHDFHSAENDNTLNVKWPLTGIAISLVINAECCQYTFIKIPIRYRLVLRRIWLYRINSFELLITWYKSLTVLIFLFQILVY